MPTYFSFSSSGSQQVTHVPQATIESDPSSQPKCASPSTCSYKLGHVICPGRQVGVSGRQEAAKNRAVHGDNATSQPSSLRNKGPYIMGLIIK